MSWWKKLFGSEDKVKKHTSPQSRKQGKAAPRPHSSPSARGTGESASADAITTPTVAAPPPTGSVQDRLASVPDRIKRGEATAISVFSRSQEANARAQAKLFSHWAKSPAGQGLDILLLKARSSDESDQFLLVKIGTRDAQWRLTQRREERERMVAKVLTKEEDDARSPVSCYENFPQPGCSLVPSGNLELIVARLRQGEYVVLDIA